MDAGKERTAAEPARPIKDTHTSDSHGWVLVLINMRDELSGGATPAHGSDTGNDSASPSSIIMPLRLMNLQRIVGKLKVGLLAQTFRVNL